MAKLTSFIGLSVAAERTFQKNLLRALVDHGMPQSALMKICTDTADQIRSLDCDEPTQVVADSVARQYEDLASILSGGDMLPR